MPDSLSTPTSPRDFEVERLYNNFWSAPVKSNIKNNNVYNNLISESADITITDYKVNDWIIK